MQQSQLIVTSLLSLKCTKCSLIIVDILQSSNIGFLIRNCDNKSEVDWSDITGWVIFLLVISNIPKKL